MKSFLLAAAASLAILTSASSAQAQDRGYRGGPQSGTYGNTNDNRWNDDDDRRYRDYNQGQWRMRNGHYWNGNRRISPAEYQRWRRWQRGQGRQNWAYQQGVRDGRRHAHRNNRGCR